jgi:nickel-dependent lactate racemase
LIPGESIPQKVMIDLNCIAIPRHRRKWRFPVPAGSDVAVLAPVYPPALKSHQIKALAERGNAATRTLVRAASKIVLIVEDSSRITVTADLVSKLLDCLLEIRGSKRNITILIAAGAHYNLSAKDLAKKVGKTAFEIHNAADPSKLVRIGASRTGIPLVFNEKVVEADLRFTVSTVNIHPLAGYSGGGKILLPGVAGLESIFPFHALPQGTPGVYGSAMRELIDEVTRILPVAYSWQLLADPAGRIVAVCGGALHEAHRQAIARLETLITVAGPGQPADLVLAGCQPFNLNLLSTFKSLNQLPKLLRDGGRLILFNEARQGVGDHYWRNDPEVVRMQQERYREIFSRYTVGVYSPGSDRREFGRLFPESFRLIEDEAGLTGFGGGNEAMRVVYLPYAPITLVR